MSLAAITWAWRVSVGRSAAKAVLVALADHADDAGRCYPSVRRLAGMTELDRKTVISAVDYLENLGLINAQRHGGRRTHYTLTGMFELSTTSTNNGTGTRFGTGTNNGSATGTKFGTRTVNNPQKKKKEGSRLPDDWLCPAQWREWAKAHTPAVNVDREQERFRDYWIGVPGQRGVKRDWYATWRNWCRHAEETSTVPKAGDRGSVKLEWAKVPRDDNQLWPWAKRHGYPDPGTMSYHQYRQFLYSHVERRLNRGDSV